MDDSTGTAIDDIETANNNGTYFGSPTMSQAGAITGNNSVLFDGADDYGSIARQISTNFSIEFWFKSTQGLGHDRASGRNYAGMVDANIVRHQHRLRYLTERGRRRLCRRRHRRRRHDHVGAGGYNDGNWHHVVITRTQSTGDASSSTSTAPLSSRNGRQHRPP